MFFLVNDPERFNLRCSPLDFSCKAQQALIDGLANTVGRFFETTLSNVKVTDNAFDAAVLSSGRLFGLSILVMFISAVFAISFGALSLNKHMLLRGLLGSLFTIPAVYFGWWFTKQALVISDAFAADLISGSTGNVLLTFFQGLSNRDTARSTKAALVAGLGGGEVAQNAFMLIVVLAFMALGGIFMAFALAFRDVGIILLIAFLPLAFAILPARGGSVWVRRWASAVTALILAKPLMFGSLAVLSKVSQGADNLFSPELFIFVVGLFVCAFLPVLAFSFFSFIGGGSAAGDHAGSAAGRQVMNVSNTILSRRGMRGLGSAVKVGRAPAVASAARRAPLHAGGGAGGGKSVTAGGAAVPKTAAPKSPPRGAAGGGARGVSPGPSTPPQAAKAPQAAKLPPPSPVPRPK